MGKYDFYYNDDQVSAMNDRAAAKRKQASAAPALDPTVCGKCGRPFGDGHNGTVKLEGYGCVRKEFVQHGGNVVVYHQSGVPLCERCF